MDTFIKKKNLKLPISQSNRWTWKKSGQKILLGTIILTALILFLNIYQETTKNYFYRLSYPVAKTFWIAGNASSEFVASFFNANGIKVENNNLKKENQKLFSRISLLEDELKKNQVTSEALENVKKDDFKVTLAQTIALDVANDFILINRGSDDGILENMTVISSTKVLFGKVSKVYKDFSQVMLISNKNSVVNVKTQKKDAGSPPIFGVVKGDGNFSAHLDLVAFEADIAKEDLLVTSALEVIFPKNLLVGKIIAQNKSDLKPFQTAIVAPFFDIKNMDHLFIITDYMKK